MNNQTITAAKIAEIYESIESDWERYHEAKSAMVRKHYTASISAKWEALGIILGTETQFELVEKVRKAARQYKEAA